MNKTRAGQFTAMWGATEASPSGSFEGPGTPSGLIPLVAYSGPSGPVIPLGVGRSFRCDVGRDWVAIWAAFFVSP